MKANIMTDGQMQNFPYLESEIVETASPSDRDSPDYFGFDANIDEAVDVFMDRLGGRLGELEYELQYAWNAVDILSQEYVRMWEKLERLEILLYEQQNVISQLLTVIQTNGANVHSSTTDHIDLMDRHDPYGSIHFNELDNQYDYDMKMSTEAEAMILAEDPSEAFSRQTFDEWLSQHSSSLQRHSEMLDKYESYETCKESDVDTRSEPHVDTSQYQPVSPPPTSRPSSTSSSRWLTRRQTLKRWQEIDDSSESFDKMSKNIREDDSDMTSPENKEPDALSHVSEVFSVTDYLDYRAQNNTTPCTGDSPRLHEDESKAQDQGMSGHESSDRYETSEQWLKGKLNACNVALIHDNESLNDKQRLDDRETTPSTVQTDDSRAPVVTDLMSLQNNRTDRITTTDMNETKDTIGRVLYQSPVSELSESSTFTNTAFNHCLHYRKPVSDLSEDNKLVSSEVLSHQIPQELHFVADLTDDQISSQVSNGELVETEPSHDRRTESVSTLDEVEVEISNAIKLINNIEENSKSYSNEFERHYSEQSSEQINNERDIAGLKQSGTERTEPSEPTERLSIGTEQTIDYLSDVSHTKALMMPITDQKNLALNQENAKTKISDTTDSDHTSEPVIAIHETDVRQVGQVMSIEVSDASDQMQDVNRDPERCEHSLKAIQRTASGKRKLPTMPSQSTSATAIDETSAQSIHNESKQYNRIEKQSTNARHDRNTFSSSVPVHPIPDIDNTSLDANGSITHRRGSSFDDNKGLFSSLATSVYQGYQSVISMPSLPSLFKRESQERIDETLINSDQKRRSGSSISGMFSGFGWKSGSASVSVTQRSQSVQQTDLCAKSRTSVHQLSLPELSSGPQDRQIAISHQRLESRGLAVSESESRRQSQLEPKLEPYFEKQQTVPSLAGQQSMGAQKSRLNSTESSNGSTAVDKSKACLQSEPPSVPSSVHTSVPSVACVGLASEKRPQSAQHMNQNLLLPSQTDHKRRPTVAREDSLSVNTNAQLEKSVSEESAFFSCVSASSRQSSIQQSEFGSMESSDSVALSLGQRDIERKSGRMRSDDDSAFCSTNGDNRSALADETDQQSVLSSTSPQTVPNVMANQFIQSMKTRSESPSVQSPTVPLEKRDSVGSTTSTGFQNRFASIMRQKLEQRSQQTNSFSQSVDISTADSSIDSDLLIDDQRGIPKKGRTKWKAAVVRKSLHFGSCLENCSFYIHFHYALIYLLLSLMHCCATRS